MTHQDEFADGEMSSSDTRMTNIFGSREATLRGAFLAGASAADMVKAMQKLRALAFGEDGEELSFAALKLFLEMTVGPASKSQRMLPPLKLPKGASLEQCNEGIGVVLEAMSSGYLSQEESEAYIAVIDKRASILRAQLNAGEGDRPPQAINVTVQRRAEAAKE